MVHNCQLASQLNLLGQVHCFSSILFLLSCYVFYNSTTEVVHRFTFIMEQAQRVDEYTLRGHIELIEAYIMPRKTKWTKKKLVTGSRDVCSSEKNLSTGSISLTKIRTKSSETSLCQVELANEPVISQARMAVNLFV